MGSVSWGHENTANSVSWGVLVRDSVSWGVLVGGVLVGDSVSWGVLVGDMRILLTVLVGEF